MLALDNDDDDKPLSQMKPVDVRVNGYSQVITEGSDTNFYFDVTPKHIGGQGGAGKYSKLKTGAFVQLSFAWQAYTREQPGQRLQPVNRSLGI